MTGEIQWSREMETGIAEIDSQHKGLFNATWVLNNAVHKGHGGEQLSAVLVEMTAYLGKHLRYEEALLRKAGYPGLEAHTAHHQRFEQEVESLKSAFFGTMDMGKRSELAIEAARFLNDWLVEHIRVEDHRYVSHVTRRP